MTITLRRLARQGLLILAIAASAAPGHARQVEGQTLAEQQLLGGTLLELNGVGVRAVAWLKGYVAGLYLTRKCRTAAEVVGAPGPKRLQLRMLQNVAADEFAKAFDRGVRRHASDAELERLQARMADFEQIVRSVGRVRKGDVIDVDYVPTAGTTMAINGRVAGPAIAGGDFHAALLQVFVGEKVTDPGLRVGLLGG